jgi:hypothetical protein
MRFYTPEDFSEAYHVASIRAFLKGKEDISIYYAKRASNPCPVGSKPDRIVKNFMVDVDRGVGVITRGLTNFIISAPTLQDSYEVDVTLKESMGIFKGVDDCEYPLFEIAKRLAHVYRTLPTDKKHIQHELYPSLLITKGRCLSNLPNDYSNCPNSNQRYTMQKKIDYAQGRLKEHLVFEGWMDKLIFKKFCNLKVRM